MQDARPCEKANSADVEMSQSQPVPILVTKIEAPQPPGKLSVEKRAQAIARA
jgi:hypothetical protein